jgi:hypothetical protein
MTRIESEHCDLTDVKRRLLSKSETNVSRCSCPNQAWHQRYSKTDDVNHSHSSIMANNVQKILQARSISEAHRRCSEWLVAKRLSRNR